MQLTSISPPKAIDFSPDRYKCFEMVSKKAAITAVDSILAKIGVSVGVLVHTNKLNNTQQLFLQLDHFRLNQWIWDSKVSVVKHVFMSDFGVGTSNKSM
ncbi:hypothetical protein GN244_ATG06222 [Phytophthora infestans]|uniref:Uncharacterized protein n=1 Tax=Phytophthora infestans TaxID=4787 RepID=A0A833TEW7_PHYIN|nr:hypothetical protein GN244_ATG06222 [Phytophthora infestans]